MIFVDRNQPEDGVVARPNAEWFAKAIKQTTQAKQDGSSHVVTNLYKHVEVKKALKKLFRNKCAYCEGEPMSQGPWDVEHYRPKGSVKENCAHPGYYWLAYTWDNLLPSCTFCNQLRKNEAGPTRGKSDHFPLVVEGDRAMDPDSPLDREIPLLLNPCVDQDCETYFRYDIQGQILPAVPGNSRAEKTIELCNLERRDLRDARTVAMEKVIKAVKIHTMALRLNNEEIANEMAEFVALFTAAKSPYAGAARFVDHNRHAFIAEQQ